MADFTLRDRWIKLETRPTGAKHPRKHKLAPQFELTLGRVWALPLAQLTGFNPARASYVLDVVWKEETTGDWHRETFYGVTISERTCGARDRDGEFIEDQVFDAEYLAPPSGGSGAVPALTTTLPLTVRYVSATEEVLLYTYDPATHVFTEAVTVTSRATVYPNAEFPNAAFHVIFAGAGFSAFRVRSDYVLEAFEYRTGAPLPGELPRLDFYAGTVRIGTVAANGRMYAAQLFNSPPAAGEGGFEFYAAGAVLCGTLAGTGLRGSVLRTFTPADLAGLRLWVEVADLGSDADFPWPDRAGVGALAAVNDVHYHATDDPLFPLEPDGRPFVYVDKDTSSHLRNQQAASLETDNHALFLVAKPGQVDGIGGGSNMGLVTTGGLGDTAAAGDLALVQLGYKLQGHFWTDAGDEWVEGTTLLGSKPVERERWVLAEQAVNGLNLKIRLNGQLEGTRTLTGDKAGATKEIFLGSHFDNFVLGFGGCCAPPSCTRARWRTNTRPGRAITSTSNTDSIESRNPKPENQQP